MAGYLITNILITSDLYDLEAQRAQGRARDLVLLTSLGGGMCRPIDEDAYTRGGAAVVVEVHLHTDAVGWRVLSAVGQGKPTAIELKQEFLLERGCRIDTLRQPSVLIVVPALFTLRNWHGMRHVAQEGNHPAPIQEPMVNLIGVAQQAVVAGSGAVDVLSMVGAGHGIAMDDLQRNAGKLAHGLHAEKHPFGNPNSALGGFPEQHTAMSSLADELSRQLLLLDLEQQ